MARDPPPRRLMTDNISNSSRPVSINPHVPPPPTIRPSTGGVKSCPRRPLPSRRRQHLPQRHHRQDPPTTSCPPLPRTRQRHHRPPKTVPRILHHPAAFMGSPRPHRLNSPPHRRRRPPGPPTSTSFPRRPAAPSRRTTTRPRRTRISSCILPTAKPRTQNTMHSSKRNLGMAVVSNNTMATDTWNFLTLRLYHQGKGKMSGGVAHLQTVITEERQRRNIQSFPFTI